MAGSRPLWRHWRGAASLPTQTLCPGSCGGCSMGLRACDPHALAAAAAAAAAATAAAAAGRTHAMLPPRCQPHPQLACGVHSPTGERGPACTLTRMHACQKCAAAAATAARHACSNAMRCTQLTMCTYTQQPHTHSSHTCWMPSNACTPHFRDVCTHFHCTRRAPTLGAYVHLADLAAGSLPQAAPT